MVTFPYYMEATAQAELIIDDLGNFAVKCFNDRGEEFILIVETRLGNTRIFTFGPVIPDLVLLPKSCSCSIEKMTFNNGKVIKAVRQFLTNPFRGITQAFEVTKEEALADCRNLVQVMNEDNF